MVTLVNKVNPAIRMTAPEIDVHEEEDMYFIPVGDYCIPMYIPDWTLIEEKPEKTREIRACIGYALACIPNEKIKDFGVSLKDCLDYVAPVDKGLREETVDLEKEAVAFCFDNGINITPYQATRIARHFYELRFNARKEE